ncbi:CBS domain-containing protein [Tsukamurella sp. USMM236]|uniref:CBS domain-containing protein n=1 Tax=Tsukamurella sp. USMM236 TaxID=3081301 RepID=UPI0030166E0B
MTPPTVTVADVMLRRPTVHPAEITVGAARTAFETSPKLHLLLLMRDGALAGTLDRDDLTGGADDAAPALAVASLTERTTPPGAPADRLRSHMITTGIRRLAVVDDDLRLLGLLCLKASRTGFCTDDGVDGMRRARRDSDGD